MAVALTRLQYEAILISRCRGMMTRAGMTFANPPTSPTADLNDPLATAMEDLGYPAADRSLVTSADLAPITGDVQARLLDLAELRTLESAYQFVVAAPQSVQYEDFKKDSGSAFLKDLADFLMMKWSRYKARWASSGVPAVGAMCDTNDHRLDVSGYYPPP